MRSRFYSEVISPEGSSRTDVIVGERLWDNEINWIMNQDKKVE